MDTKLQTSFIPKKPLIPGTPGAKQTRHTSFVTVLLFLVFLVALSGAALVFAYTQYLQSRISTMEKSIQQAEASLDPALINEWVRLDKRIESSKSLLHTHLAISSFFTLLQTATL